jgi:hypothetical protein
MKRGSMGRLVGILMGGVMAASCALWGAAGQQGVAAEAGGDRAAVAAPAGAGKAAPVTAQDLWALYLKCAGEDRANEEDAEKMAPFVAQAAELGPATVPALLEILRMPYWARGDVVAEALRRMGVLQAAACSDDFVAGGASDSEAAAARASFRGLLQVVEGLETAIAHDASSMAPSVAREALRDILQGITDEGRSPWLQDWARGRLLKPELADPPWPVRNAYNGQAVRDLYRALSLCEREFGHLPHGEGMSRQEAVEDALAAAGWASSLPQYPRFSDSADDGDRLDVSVCDMRFTLLDNGRAYIDPWGPPLAHSRLVCGDFDYLNKAIPLDRSSPSFVVYAEKRGSSPGGRWVVFSNGAVMWVRRDNPHYASPLGKSRSELMAGQPGAGYLPEVELDRYCMLARRTQFQEVQLALLNYAGDHGTTPYSEKGPEYALYKLKPYVPDAAAFDSLYTFIENGTAYWDDEQGRLVNGDYLYLNKPVSRGEVVVVMASEWYGIESDTRAVLLSDVPTIHTVTRETPHAEDPLGRAPSELKLRGF